VLSTFAKLSCVLEHHVIVRNCAVVSFNLRASKVQEKANRVFSDPQDKSVEVIVVQNSLLKVIRHEDLIKEELDQKNLSRSYE